MLGQYGQCQTQAIGIPQWLLLPRINFFFFFHWPHTLMMKRRERCCGLTALIIIILDHRFSEAVK